MVMGLFAGRGDVVLAMGLALLVGVWIGWQGRKFLQFLKDRKTK